MFFSRILTALSCVQVLSHHTITIIITTTITIMKSALATLSLPTCFGLKSDPSNVVKAACSRTHDKLVAVVVGSHLSLLIGAIQLAPQCTG